MIWQPRSPGKEARMSEEEKLLRVELESKENDLQRLRAQLNGATKVNTIWD
jgi:hypothetical protein